MKKKEIFVDVSPEKMQIRNYDPYLTVASTQVGWGDSKNDYLIVPKNEYRAFLKNKLKLSQYKCNALIKVYIDLDMIKEDKDYYYFYPARTRFISLTIPTAVYFLDNLSDFVFKVYCWLLDKYELHLKYYKNGENFFFSKIQLLEGIGYTKGTKVWAQTINALNTLEELGFIKYNHEAVGKPGKHGTYLELYWVNKYGSVQVKANKDLIKEFEGQELDDETKLRAITWNKKELEAIESGKKIYSLN